MLSKKDYEKKISHAVSKMNELTNGDATTITIETAIKIANQYDITLDELFEIENKRLKNAFNDGYTDSATEVLGILYFIYSTLNKKDNQISIKPSNDSYQLVCEIQNKHISRVLQDILYLNSEEAQIYIEKYHDNNRSAKTASSTEDGFEEGFERYYKKKSKHATYKLHYELMLDKSKPRKPDEAPKTVAQTKVADLTGINVNTLTKYINGEHGISIESALKIVDYYEISLDELFGIENEHIDDFVKLLKCLYVVCRTLNIDIPPSNNQVEFSPNQVVIKIHDKNVSRVLYDMASENMNAAQARDYIENYCYDNDIIIENGMLVVNDQAEIDRWVYKNYLGLGNDEDDEDDED